MSLLLLPRTRGVVIYLGTNRMRPVVTQEDLHVINLTHDTPGDCCLYIEIKAVCHVEL